MKDNLAIIISMGLVGIYNMMANIIWDGIKKGLEMDMEYAQIVEEIIKQDVGLMDSMRGPNHAILEPFKNPLIQRRFELIIIIILHFKNYIIIF